MRVEMELRYKANSTFLTTYDKTRLHGYWVPCSAQIKEQFELLEAGLSAEGNLTPRPVMIFCNPNGGFAEFF